MEVIIGSVLLMIIVLVASQVFINVYSSSLSNSQLQDYFNDENIIQNLYNNQQLLDSVQGDEVNAMIEREFARDRPIKVLLYKPDLQ